MALLLAAYMLGLVGRRVGCHMQQRAVKNQRAACRDFTDLPVGVINHIILMADGATRRAVFRDNKQLRNAVLGCVAGSSTEQPTTHLHLTTEPLNLSERAHAASKLLQLAAGSSHVIHLHIKSIFTFDQALQHTRCAPLRHLGAPTSDASSCPHVTSVIPYCFYDKAWLSALFKPWLQGPAPLDPLLHVTTISLQDMTLEMPLQDSIGRACPALKHFRLENVAWPEVTSSIPRIWPTLEQLTLQDICPLQLPKLFNPSTLPQLSSLSVSWPSNYGEAQRKAYVASAARIGTFCVGFKQQLTMLQLKGLPWFHVMNAHLSECFPKLIKLCIADENDWDQQHDVSDMRHYDQIMPYIVRNLQQFHVSALALSKCHASYRWNKLADLCIGALEGDVMRNLACMPRMPGLQLVTLPGSISEVRVTAGSDWLADVVKAMGMCSQGCDSSKCLQGQGRRWCRLVHVGKSVFATVARLCKQVAKAAHAVVLV